MLAVFPEAQVYEEWMGGNLNDALLFKGMRLHFSDCDSSAPLFNSTLEWIVIHQRADARLFGRPMTEWTKETLIQALRDRAYEVLTPSNGDVEVPQLISYSFDDDERLVWLEL